MPHGQSPTSMDAEAQALIAVADYLLCRPVVPGLEVHVHFDATTVGFAATGEQNIPGFRLNRCSKQMEARIMMSLVQKKFDVCKGYHVHAHRSNPFNELADGVAGLIRKGFSVPIKPVLRVSALLAHPLREWAWVEINKTTEIPGLQQMVRESPIQSCEAWPDHTLSTVTKTIQTTANASVKDLIVAAANVGTCDYNRGDEGACMSFKVQELAKQFDGQNLDIVCLQESRAKVTCTSQVGPYARLISSANAGQGGVEIWFHVERLRLLSGMDFVVEKDVTTWYHDHRILAVYVDCGPLQVHVISIYAPQSGKPMPEVSAWWTSLDALLRQKPHDAPVWLMGDCNARLGSVESACVGGLAPDFEDKAGEMMHDVCRNHQLCVPTTWEEVHHGQSDTFWGPRGGGSRLDYFLIDMKCQDAIVATWVDQEINLLNGDRDHSPIVLHLQMKFAAKHTNTLQRRNLYDRHAARSKAKDAAYNAARQIPQIPWSTHVYEHWSIVRDSMQTSAARMFPKRKRQKRQIFFSDSTWEHVCTSKDLKAQHRHQKALLQNCTLTLFFKAWRNDVDGAKMERLRRHVLNMQEAVTFEQKLRVEAKYRTGKKHDWKDWVRTQLDRKIEDLDRQGANALFQILQPKKMIARNKGTQTKPLPGLRNESGEWCFTRGEVAVAWQKQFSRIERAARVDLDHFQPDVNAHKRLSQVDLHDIPTLYDLEWAFRAMDARKAPGLDSLGAELYQAEPVHNSMRMYSLFVKSALRQEWPSELSGGWLLSLYKGKGAASSMSNHRGIMLEPTLARSFSRSWRDQVARGAAQVAQPNQWGGRRGLSCAAMHLQIRLWQQTAAVKRQSQSLLFIDVKAAFYSVAKDLLVATERTEEDFERLCSVMNIPSTAQDAFQHNLRTTDAVWKSTNSKAAAAIVGASLGKTWFVVPDGEGIFAPKCGSRPGDPMADLLFSMIMSEMLRQINDRCYDEGVWSHDLDNEAVAPSVTWVDDVAFMVTCEAKSLRSCTAHLVSIVVDVTTEFGFELSMGPGKTALVMTYRGRGATQARQEMERECPAGLTVLTEHRGAVQIPKVTHYKHLGGFITAEGNCHPEIRVRGAQATSRLQPLRKILRDARIDVKYKRTILKTMGFTVLQVNSGTWWNLTEGEYKAWQAAWFRVGGMMTPREQDGSVRHVTMVERAHLTQCPMPQEMLMLQRLRLCGHVLQDQDPFMIGVIMWNHKWAKEQSWWSAVQNALKWLQHQIGRSDELEALQKVSCTADWTAQLPTAKVFKKMIKQADRAHLLRVRAYQAVSEGEAEQAALLQEMGWMKHSDVHLEEPPDEGFACSKCTFVGKTAAALGTHEQRKHGDRVALRRFLEDGVCRACQRQFHSRPRLLQHLHNGATACWLYILRNFEPMTLEDMKALDDQDRLLGVACHQRGFKHAIFGQACRPCTNDELLSRLQMKPEVDLNDGPPMQEELQAWSRYGLLPPGKGGRPLTQRGASAFHVANVLEDVQILEQTLARQVHEWSPDFDWVPRPMSQGQLYVLVFFSGHRREGDLAMHIHENSDLVTLNVDTAIDEHFGNVHRTEFFVHLIHSRKVIAGHGGPPCESFTMARWLEHENGCGPQPLRTKSHPWVLPELNLKELVQCLNGSELFIKVLFLLTLIHAHGGATTLEHPRGPEGLEGPNALGWSIWMTSFVQRLLLGPSHQLVTFLQGPLGRPFSKPTRFLAGNLPELAKDLYSNYNPTWRPSMILGGKDQSGAWKTSAGKEYPSLLCKVMALNYVKHYQQIAREGEEPDPAGLEERVNALGKIWDPYVCFGQMKTDFQSVHFT